MGIFFNAIRLLKVEMLIVFIVRVHEIPKMQEENIDRNIRTNHLDR
jgi:hypothetical protein